MPIGNSCPTLTGVPGGYLTTRPQFVWLILCVVFTAMTAGCVGTTEFPDPLASVKVSGKPLPYRIAVAPITNNAKLPNREFPSNAELEEISSAEPQDPSSNSVSGCPKTTPVSPERVRLAGETWLPEKADCRRLVGSTIPASRDRPRAWQSHSERGRFRQPEGRGDRWLVGGGRAPGNHR